MSLVWKRGNGAFLWRCVSRIFHRQRVNPKRVAHAPRMSAATCVRAPPLQWWRWNARQSPAVQPLSNVRPHAHPSRSNLVRLCKLDRPSFFITQFYSFPNFSFFNHKPICSLSYTSHIFLFSIITHFAQASLMAKILQLLFFTTPMTI